VKRDARIAYLEEKPAQGEYCPMALRETIEMIEKNTFKNGQKAEIEAKCGIFEYTLQTKKGFGIGFTNNSKTNYKINVEWTLNNLVYLQKKDSNVAEFDLPAGKSFFNFLQIVNAGKPSSYDEGLSYDAVA